MAARVKGWSQVRLTSATSSSALNASTDINVNPASAAITASDRGDTLVFLKAGTAYQIRWGGIDGNNLVWGAGLASNTTAWRCDVMYETTQTSAASDSITGASLNPVDRTFSFTPTLTGTYRLKVNLIVTVTVGGAAFANDNTDNGNFGSSAPSRLSGSTLVSFNPGLIAVGAVGNSITETGGNASGIYATYGMTITNTLVMSAGSQGTDASETMNMAWQQSVTTFANTTIPTTTSATKADPGLLVANAATTGWPNKTAFSPNLILSIANSALSTALGGAGIPWTFFSGALPTGWTATVSNAVGATTITKSAAFTADNTLTHQKYMQLNTTTVQTPPDGLTDLTHNVTFKTSSDVGEITHRVKDANGNGVNGISYTSGSIKIQDVNGLVAGDTRPGANLNTATLGGAAGWVVATGGLGGANPNFLGWPDVNPSGVWNYSWTISTANAVGLDNPPSPVTFTLQAQNPGVHIVSFLNGTSQAASGQRHLLVGDSMLVIATAEDDALNKRIAPDSGTTWMTHFRQVQGLSYARVGTTVTVTQASHNLSTGDIPQVIGATDSGLNGTQTVTGTVPNVSWTFTTASAGAANGTMSMGVLENLISDTDNTFAAWKPWGPNQGFVTFALVPDPVDGTQLNKTFNNTAGWGPFPVVVRTTLIINGVFYAVSFYREIVSTANPHSGYQIDPILLALGGKIGTR